MRLISNAGAAGLVCLLVAVATMSVRAYDGFLGERTASAAIATTLAFNPQPDPPGRSDEEFGFDHG